MTTLVMQPAFVSRPQTAYERPEESASGFGPPEAGFTVSIACIGFLVSDDECGGAADALIVAALRAEFGDNALFAALAQMDKSEGKAREAWKAIVRQLSVLDKS